MAFKKGQVTNPTGRKPGSKNRAKALFAEDTVKAAEMALGGESTTAIAKALHATPEAVKSALSHSRRLLEIYTPHAAAKWVRAIDVAAENGDHKPAMALLQSVKSIEPIAQTYETPGGSKATAAVNVQIVGFEFAGLPKPAQPVIDVTKKDPSR
jgi:hypothetical protein